MAIISEKLVKESVMAHGITKSQPEAIKMIVEHIKAEITAKKLTDALAVQYHVNDIVKECKQLLVHAKRKTLDAGTVKIVLDSM